METSISPPSQEHTNWLKLIYALLLVKKGVGVFVKEETLKFHHQHIADLRDCQESMCKYCSTMIDLCWYKTIEKKLHANTRDLSKKCNTKYKLTSQIREIEQYWEIACYYNYNCRENQRSDRIDQDKMDVYGLMLNMTYAKHLGDKLAEDNSSFQAECINSTNDIFAKVKSQYTVRTCFKTLHLCPNKFIIADIFGKHIQKSRKTPGNVF